MFEKISKSIPLVTFAALTVAYAYKAGYYSSFSIDILNYVTIQDLLLSLLPVVIFLGCFYGFAIYLIKRVLKIEQEGNTTTKDKYQKWEKYLFIVLLIGNIISLFFPFHGMALLGICTGLYTIYLSLYPFVKAMKGQPYAYELQALVILLAFIFIVNQYAIQLARETKHFGVTKKICFRKGNIIYATNNDSLLLIGQTTNVLFLFNKKYNSTEVVKVTEIDSIVFK